MAWKLVAVLLALGASVSAAQNKATELTAGVIGISHTACPASDCAATSIVSTGGAENGIFSGVGGSSFGVGFYLSPRLSIEPTVSFSRVSGGGTTFTIVSIGAAVPIYLAKSWGHKGPYLAPGFTYNSIDEDGESTTQFMAGAAIGTKVRLNDMAALRLQANFDFGFPSDVPFTTTVGALMGLSVFLGK